MEERTVDYATAKAWVIAGKGDFETDGETMWYAPFDGGYALKVIEYRPKGR